MTPVQLPIRRVPLAVKEKLKVELSCLENLGVVKEVYIPTDWISAMVVTMKDGRIIVCIDPKPLNQVLKRNHYLLPILEEALPHLAKVKFFTGLDAKNGFWHVSLDEESSYTITFGTLWGQFKWLGMPFGIASDQKNSREEDCKAIAADVLYLDVVRGQNKAWMTTI